MNIIFGRVANWNSLRYEQKFDLELAIALLKEETEEFNTEDEVERIDALGDIIYVALGCIWKLGHSLDLSTLESFITHYQVLPFNINEESSRTINLMRVYRGNMVTCVNLHTLIAACYVGLCMTLASEQRAKQALLAICDSNDSKEPKRTAANVKANGTSKGPDYFSPTAVLTQLIKERDDVKCH